MKSRHQLHGKLILHKSWQQNPRASHSHSDIIPALYTDLQLCYAPPLFPNILFQQEVHPFQEVRLIGISPETWHMAANGNATKHLCPTTNMDVSPLMKWIRILSCENFFFFFSLFKSVNNQPGLGVFAPRDVFFQFRDKSTSYTWWWFSKTDKKFNPDILKLPTSL